MLYLFYFILATRSVVRSYIVSQLSQVLPTISCDAEKDILRLL